MTDDKPEDNTQDPSTDVVAADAQVDQAVGVRRGMFGTTGTGDTSGYGGLVAPVVLPGAAQRPYGGWYDEVADALEATIPVDRVVIDRGEVTFHVRREDLPVVARTLRDDPALHFEFCSGVSGVHYPGDTGRELHAVYHLLSMTYNRRIRLEVSAPDSDPHIPSIVDVYPTNDWHERETYDMFGIIFDGHPALVRILMPDDWPGHPQRKDYPLGGIPVEYKGGSIPPPDERRSYFMTTDQDMYAGNAETGEGRVFTVTGQDWDSITQGLSDEVADERVVVNMGPQHPSTHGVLRLILELEGETVTEARCGIGYLHTGIEKNMEYRSWVQGVTFCTRMDYLSPFYNEMTYSLGVERLLGIEDDIPEKAEVMRVLLMELNRISSHLVCIATGGMEIGALTVMTIGFRERELVLDLFELITGLRMNHAFIRPGGVAQDLPRGALDQIKDFVALMKKRLPEYAALCNANPIFKGRLEGVGHLDLEGCLALGISGPVLRSTGYAWDLRKTQPYSGYEDYEFDVQTWDTCDSYGRFRIRLNEMWESLRIVEQAAARLGNLEGAPVMVADKKIAWPSQLAIGSDGMGNSLDHIRHIMGESMEALIHHFKLVTEGFRVPAGQAYVPVESPRGELGAHVVSDGGTRPFRAHFRDPSFTNLQATSVMSEGGQVADVIVAIASIDPVMGGVDR